MCPARCRAFTARICLQNSRSLELSGAFTGANVTIPPVGRDPLQVQSATPGFSSINKKEHRHRRCSLWWRRRDSNPRHPACKAGALPLSYAPTNGLQNLSTSWLVREAQRARLETQTRENHGSNLQDRGFLVLGAVYSSSRGSIGGLVRVFFLSGIRSPGRISFPRAALMNL